MQPHQRLCEQLRPVLRRELERFRPLAGASAECEVELCPLTFSHWTDTTDVSIRPLVAQTAAGGDVNIIIVKKNSSNMDLNIKSSLHLCILNFYKRKIQDNTVNL